MWVIDFLSALPLWLLAIVLNAWLMGSALVGLWIARRWVFPRLRMHYEDGYLTGPLAQSVMLLYGLIAALTAVGVWQRYSEVSSLASAEATAIASLWRDLGGYPEPTRGAARDVLRSYTEQVINVAWPKQSGGEIPLEGIESIDRLETDLLGFEPVTEGQKVLHAETVHAFNELVQARRQRLDSVQQAIPGVLWWVLLPGALGCIVAFVFFYVDNVRLHALLLVGLSAFLSTVLLVIIALERPYSGDTAVGPDSYRLVYDHQMRAP
jgi:hypothetical protein